MKITINNTATSVEQDDIEEIVNRIKLLLEIEGYARDTIEGYIPEYRDDINEADAYTVHDELEKLKTDYDVLNANTNKIISELKERLNEPCPNHCNDCLKNTHGVVGDSGLRFITNTKFPENKR